MERSKQDTELMAGILAQFKSQFESDSQTQVPPVSSDELTLFVRNCSEIRALRTNSIRQELESPNWSEDVASEL